MRKRRLHFQPDEYTNKTTLAPLRETRAVLTNEAEDKEGLRAQMASIRAFLCPGKYFFFFMPLSLSFSATGGKLILLVYAHFTLRAPGASPAYGLAKRPDLAEFGEAGGRLRSKLPNRRVPLDENRQPREHFPWCVGLVDPEDAEMQGMAYPEGLVDE
jgi:hypothetical protein